MAIQINESKQIPAIDLKFLQFTNFNLSVARTPPYKISISAKVENYGLDADGKRFYDNDHVDFSDRDVMASIESLSTEQKERAMEALDMIQTGLGIMASIKTEFDFDKVVEDE